MHQPDLIVGVGADVAKALAARLNTRGHRTVLVKVDFPGRLNLNSRFIPKGRQLISSFDHDPGPLKREIRELLVGTPDSDGHIQRAIETDWYYFAEMKRSIATTLARYFRRKLFTDC